MGTNFYAVFPAETQPCPTCGQPHLTIPRWHIGKSSGGWCFSLHVGSDREPEIPKNLEEWKVVWQTARIENEYGDVFSPEEMEKIITQRKWSGQKDDWWFERNQAIVGPNNLARHPIGRGCIGHGEGTYDLVTGSFS
jgi:hypothetical protein